MSWMKVIALREALKQGSTAREHSDEPSLAVLKDLPDPNSDAEFTLIKHRYRREFYRAVREAFVAISKKQRHLLRLHFMDGLSTTELGLLFHVNQSTISRWLRDSRQAVYTATKHILKDRLRLSSREFESLLPTIISQFDLNLGEVLGPS